MKYTHSHTHQQQQQPIMSDTNPLIPLLHEFGYQNVVVRIIKRVGDEIFVCAAVYPAAEYRFVVTPEQLEDFEAEREALY